MKKIFLLIILFSFFQNNISAQGCSDYFTIEYVSSEIHNGDCNDFDLIEVSINLSQTEQYTSSTKPSSVHVIVNLMMDCGSSNEEAFADGDIIIPPNPVPGVWYNVSVSSHPRMTANFKYRLRPKNPTVPNITDDNSSNIFNENDIINRISVNTNTNIIKWEFKTLDNSYNNTFYDNKILNNYALNNMDITSHKQLKITATAVAGAPMLKTELESCYDSSVIISVYPRRPIIQSTTETPPSCRGDGDGTIKINTIDGELGTGTGEGSVIAYKVQFFAESCDSIRTKIENEQFSQIQTLNFKGSNPKLRYLEEFPIIFTIDSFADGELLSQDYCIQIENSYILNDTMTWNNGNNLYNFNIPPKDSLYANITPKHLNCNEDGTGKITLTAGGGNEGYTAFLFNENTYTGQSETINSSGGTCSFNNLSASNNYRIQLKDQNNCNVFVETNEQDSNFVKDIIVKEPDVLEITNLSHTNVLCKGDNTASITFNITGGTKNSNNNYYYKLYDAQTPEYIFGEGYGVNEILTEDLPAMDYLIYIKDSNNCTKTSDVISVTQPATAVHFIEMFAKNYNGVQISCKGANDGVIHVNSSGGTGNRKCSYVKLNPPYINDITDNGIFTDVYPGTYRIKITDENGCYYDVPNSIILNEPDSLKLTLPIISDYNGKNISCTGYNDGWIDISSTGGTGEKRFSIENNKNNGGPGPNPIPSHTFDNLSVGDKKITVTDVNNCTYTKTYKLTQPESSPAIDTFSVSNFNGFGVHCNGDTDGTISIREEDDSGTPYSGEFKYFYAIDGGTDFSKEPDFDNLAPGNYYLVISDANNCLSDDIHLNISEPGLIVPSAISPLKRNSPYNITCNNSDDGEVYISANGGVYTDDYYCFFNNNLSNDTLTGLSAGQYPYFVKDANNCISETKNIELLQPDSLALSYDTSTYTGNHAIRCFGLSDTLKIKPSGGFGAGENGHYEVTLNSFPYININPGDSIAKFPIYANNDYTIEIKDENNCIFNFPETLRFSQPNKMASTLLTTEPTLCHNSTDGKLNIKWQGGSENYTYYLKKGNNFIDTLYNNNTNNTSTFNGLNADTYSVKVIDENNCEDLSETILLNSPDEIIVEETITEQPICFGDTLGSFNLSGTGGTAIDNIFDFYIKTSYGDSIFIPDTNLALFENIKLGTHKFFALDDNNCISEEDSLTIEAPPELIAETQSTNVSAHGASDGSATVTPEGGTPAYRYLWKDENNIIIGSSNNITNSPAGDYTVELWDAHNCPFHDVENGLIKNITIHEPNFTLELIIEQVHNVSFPGANDGSVSLNSNGGWNEKLYKKQYGIYSAVRDYQNLSAGTYWFYVKDSYGVVDSAQVTISEIPPMQITDINIENVSCFGENNGTANFIVTGGTLPYLYSLNNIDFLENNYFENLPPGSYTVYIKDARDYKISQDFTILQPTQALSLNITDIQNTSCGASDGLATVLAQGGTSPYQYNWEELGLYTVTASGLPAGTYNVTVTDENLCTASMQIIINNSDGPVIENIITENTNCYNTADGSASITNIIASGSYTIQWSNGQTGSMTAENLSSGNYTVQVTDENDCFVTESFTINSPEILSFNFNENNPICFDACNGSITANLSGGSTPYILEWENISGNPTTNHVSNLCANNYILNVTDAHNCEYTSTAILENPEQIIILEENQATICQGQEITLDAGNEGSSYSWTGDNFQSYEQSVTLNEAGTYYVNLVTPQGCTAQDEFTLNFSSDYLQANFLMQSEAEIADTVVLVEISWEAPDSVSWYFPQELWVLSQTEENVQLIPTQSGTFTVGLTAHLGTCSDFLEKQITITGTPDKGLTQPKYFSDDAKQFQSINLYPNPNNGNFTLDISLFEENDVLIEVYDLLGQKQQTHKIGKGEKKYTFDFNISNLKQGLYFISIKTDKGTAGLKFLKQ